MRTATTLAALAALVGVGLLLADRTNHHRPMQSRHFKSLGDLPGGISDSLAYGVSADGSVVVGYSNSAAGMEAFRWTSKGGMAGLGFPQAVAVSADGAVVVGYRHATAASEPVRWTPDGTLGLGMLPGLHEHFCGVAQGTSADGSVIVGTYSSVGHGNDVPFCWTPSGGIERLDRFPGKGHRGSARAVSADGSVIVGTIHHESDRREAFRWTEKTGIVPMGELPGDTDSIARAVSADGSVVVGCSYSIGCQAFRWTQETGMVSLGTLPGGSRNSRALGVSADGSLIVGQAHGELGLEAFVWDTAQGMRSLRQVLMREFDLDASLSRWKLCSATAVTPDGLCATGFGFNPSGHREAWIAYLGHKASTDTSPLQFGHHRLANLQ